MTGAEADALWLSLRTAALATALVAGPAVATGLLLARLRGPLRVALEVVAMAPLVLPPVVTGFALLWLLSPVAFTPGAAVLAAAVMAFPLFVRSVRLTAESLDPGLVPAARTLGASPVRAFATVTLPLLAPGIATGALLAFARALGEFGATIVFAGSFAGRTRTLPLAIWTALQRPGGDPGALRLAMLALGVSGLALVASEVLARRTRL